MLKRRIAMVALMTIGAVGLAANLAPAQEDPKPPARQGEGGGGPGGGRGNWDPAEMRKRMEERMKESMGATDDEWKVLQPKLEKVMTLQMQSRMGGMMGGRRGGGPGGPPGGPGGDQAQSEVGKAGAELRAVLEDKDAKAEAIKPKLEALRAARAKAREELAKAQKDLRDVLSLRQEASLVSMGMLD